MRGELEQLKQDVARLKRKQSKPKIKEPSPCKKCQDIEQVYQKIER